MRPGGHFNPGVHPCLLCAENCSFVTWSPAAALLVVNLRFRARHVGFVAELFVWLLPTPSAPCRSHMVGHA